MRHILSLVLLLAAASLHAQSPAPIEAGQLAAPQAPRAQGITVTVGGQPIEAGKFQPGGSAGMGKATALSLLTYGLAGTPDMRLDAIGEQAENKVPSTAEIRITGYSPKVDGPLVLVRPKAEDGKRYVRITADGKNEINKMHSKGVPKQSLVKGESSWTMTLEKALEPGHYLLMIPGQMSFWDFDVQG